MENHHILEETEKMWYLEAVWDPGSNHMAEKGQQLKKTTNKQEVQVEPAVQ